MSYIVDIIIILIFAVVVAVSAKRGFFRSLFDLIGSLLAFIAARILSASFAPQAYSMFIEKAARATLTGSLGTVGTTDYGAQIEQAINSIPDSMSGVMELMGINKQAILEKVSASQFAEGNLVDNIMANIVEPVGTAVIQFVLFALLAAVLVIVIKVVVRLLDFIIKKLPAIKQLNKGLGVLIGVLKGLLTVIIVSMVLGVAVSFTGSEAFIDAVNSSVIVSAVKNLISLISGAVI